MKDKLTLKQAVVRPICYTISFEYYPQRRKEGREDFLEGRLKTSDNRTFQAYFPASLDNKKSLVKAVQRASDYLVELIENEFDGRHHEK